MLTREFADRMVAGMSLLIGTACVDGAPHAGRVWGVEVLDLSGRLRVLLDAEDSRTIANVARGGRVAFTASEVQTHLTFQMKGRAARVDSNTASSVAAADKWAKGFLDAINAFDGYDREALEQWRQTNCVAAEIEVFELFDQAPGPKAGRQLNVRTSAHVELARGDGAADFCDESSETDNGSDLTLDHVRRAIEGWIPKVAATVAGDGTPNVTYLSALHIVDHERLAVSNQFMSKTSRNLAENPRLSLMIIDPVSVSEYRLSLTFERTERRGPTFERLRREVDDIASLVGMHDVFRLRAADIFRLERVDVIHERDEHQFYGLNPVAVGSHPPIHVGRLGLLAQRLSRSTDLEHALDLAVDGLDELLGYTHSMVFVLGETGDRLVALASRGFSAQGVGAEIAVGEGAAGLAAQRGQAIRVTDLQQMEKYGRNVRRGFDTSAPSGLDTEIPLPFERETRSRLAVPAMSRGQVVGVVVVESPLASAFDDDDEQAVGVVASILAGLIELDQERTVESEAVLASPVATPTSTPVNVPGGVLQVRFFESDGSVFLGDDYLIRGVAGRVLWSMLKRFESTASTDVTLKELRLDKSLELPGFRDNLDTRVILLKRRLEERDAPIRIHRPGRGRFTLEVPAAFELQHN
ncbi:MAG: pyridoxamine 5'-phosphate oxidase family protein [Acidimicrobiales bacterium]